MSEKFDPFVAEWISFATSGKYNLVEKCLKLAQILEYPNLDITHYIDKINGIGQTLKTSVDVNIKNPTYRISVLNEHVFGIHGFCGDGEDFYNPKNNFLNNVIDKKTGIPITLSILYAEIAKHVGLDLRIVGFPSHVIVKYKEEIVLDPFNKGRLLNVDDLRQILDVNYGGQVKFVPDYLNEIEPEKILIRLARNLKNSYIQSYAYDKAMRCVDMVLALEPGSPEDIRDKGIILDRLLNYNESLKFLEKYLEMNPDALDADFVLDLIASIRNKISR